MSDTDSTNITRSGNGTPEGDTRPPMGDEERDKCPNPFERRSSIARSPPQKILCQEERQEEREWHSESEVDSLRKTTVDNRKKRKREPAREEDTPTERDRRVNEGIVQETLEFFKNVSMLTKDLEEQIKKNTNTKKEIKEIVARLKNVVANKRNDSIIDALRHASMVDTMKNSGRGDGNASELDVIGKIEKGGTYEEYKVLVEKVWSLDAYQNTKTTVGNPIQSGTESQVVLIEPDDEKMERGIQRLYKESFPELEDLTGELEILERTTTSRMGKNKVLSKNKIIKGSYNGEEKSLWRTLQKIKNEVAEERCVTIHHLKRIQTSRVRKMVEMVFSGSEVVVEIFSIKPTNQGISNMNKMNKDKGERRTCALIVEEEGLSYKDILTKIKQNVKNGNEGKKIRNVKQTKMGKLILTMENDKEAIKELKNKILRNPSNMKIRELNNESQKTVIIRGMDEITSKEEVMEAIKATTGEPEHKIRLSELRPNVRNTQNVTATLGGEAADYLIEQRHLRIGIVLCRVQEKLRVKSCNRCLGYNHKSSECKGPDRRKLCFNCGGEGHAAKECKEQRTFCPVCNTDTHKRGTAKCPAFRDALANRQYNKQRSRMTSVSSIKSDSERGEQEEDESSGSEAANNTIIDLHGF